jgi:hypothetical protein
LSKNYYLYVHSSRSKTKQGREAVEKYLRKYKFPFDKVVAYKPPAKYYIDDRAIRFNNWNQTLKELAILEKDKKCWKKKNKGTFTLAFLSKCTRFAIMNVLTIYG